MASLTVVKTKQTKFLPDMQQRRSDNTLGWDNMPSTSNATTHDEWYDEWNETGNDITQNWDNNPNYNPQDRPPEEGGYENSWKNTVDIDDSIKGIFVHRFDLNNVPTEELQQTFKAFGKILTIKRPNNETTYCFVNFYSHFSVRAVLYSEVFLRGKRLSVAPKWPRQYPKASPKRVLTRKEDNYIDYDFACLNREGKSFDEDIVGFIETVEEDPEVYSKKVAVGVDLERVFRPTLKKVNAKLFGSSTTGLGFKDSDTDIFMHCPDGQPPRDFVEKHTNIMFTAEYFKDVVKISHARVPIVKFTHVETGLSTDVTFLNQLGVKTSRLVKFIVSLDPRIRQMMMVIKYWARCQNLTQVGKFSNHSLVLMVIFFLQQLKEPLVPSIEHLQSLVKKTEYCEFWVCSVCTDASAIPPITNTTSIQELLFEFFKFYVYFDFSKYVVCPYFGERVKKSKFKNPKNLPDEFRRYKYYCELFKKDKRNKPLKLNSLMVVQDPFDLSNNVTKCVYRFMFLKFRDACENAADEIFRKRKEKLLMHLFTLPMESHPIERFGGIKGLYNRDIYMDCFSLPVSFKQTKGQEYKVLWFKAVQFAVFNVFKHIYKMELRNDEKCAPPINVYSHLVFRTVQIEGDGALEMFRGRKKIKSQLIMRGGKEREFDRECCVSMHLHKDLIEGSKEDEPGKGNCLERYSLAIKFLSFPKTERPKLTIQFLDRSCSSNDTSSKNSKKFISLMTPTFEHYIKIAIPDVFRYFSLLATDPAFGNNIQDVIFDDEYLHRYINQKDTCQNIYI